MELKSLIWNIADKITNLFGIKNIIAFESVPYYSDNTKAVFDELIRRGWNETYEFVWLCETVEDTAACNKIFAETKNVKAIYALSYQFKFYYKKRAKAFIVCNHLPHKAKKTQYYCDLAHGCALKDVSGKYAVPEVCMDADVMTISTFMAPYDAKNLSISSDNMVALGYARNDELFEHIDIHTAFPRVEFNKLIYWMPTYRQNRWGDPAHSNISMPIIYNAEIAAQINDCAKENGVLVVVKVHQAQDISKITEYNFSNLLFIKGDYFKDKDFTNYQLLGSSDALVSDYSSVYYDYLLCDKPIALCFDDFEEYKKREGFTVDPDMILAGGKKLYTADDFCAFIKSVAQGKDELCEKRREICDLVHDHIDNKSTQRIVDYLETKMFK